MKSLSWTLSLSLLVPQARAAVKEFTVRNRVPVVQGGARSYESSRQSYPFRVEILADDESPKSEAWRGGRPFVGARPGERYSIRLYNPLPVRAAVNVTVDGLNTITGKPSGIADGAKWMIEPGSFIVLRGWQVNEGEARRFFFTDKPKSYASWQGETLHRDLSANCGVIGAAFFWSRSELANYYESHPVYRDTPRPWIYGGVYDQAKKSGDIGLNGGSGMAARGAASAASAPAPEQQAGTGMGERESNPTQQVEFRYDEGMYRASQAVLVYYDFPSPAVSPNPFPGYAAEMP